MAKLVKVAEAKDLAPGQGKLVEVDGQPIALFNVNGAFHAVGAVCPHEGGPLEDGELDGDTVICPWHGYEFSLRTGECSTDPDLRAATFVVKTEGTDVFIEVV
ncbi:MAG TPA: Rieske 2Fe-2S domain-containing protein [Candidatus Methylomirabilis sp.]|nr:Rieske 2Fe-2S domain-containing protein [Candidatus Methylomirabilis sp.]